MPERRTLPALREAVQGCRGCDLYRDATQAVFGEGARHAEVLLRRRAARRQGGPRRKPFVGPAGPVARPGARGGGHRPLARPTSRTRSSTSSGRRAESGGSTRSRAGRRSTACRPWLDAELDAVRPNVLVCLGATAAQSLLGRDFRVTQDRGELLDSDLAEHVTATIHPSAILRQQDEESRHAEFSAFVDDLRVVAQLLDATAARRSA